MNETSEAASRILLLFFGMSTVRQSNTTKQSHLLKYTVCTACTFL